MSKQRIAVIGLGHVGCSALEAIRQEPDMELAGVVELPHAIEQAHHSPSCMCAGLSAEQIVTDIGSIFPVHTAIVCCPSRSVRNVVGALLEKGIHTVDSFDIHSQIPQLRRELGDIARRNNAVSIISAGWDPGIDSVVRAWFTAMAPKGITHTNYGPGMSMGHTCAVKDIPGVKNALSVTVPAGMGIHRRMVYVELAPGADFTAVENAVKQDPYFIKDKTYVFEVPDVDSLIDMGHGVMMERKGVSGVTHNQLMRLEMRINNPALTAQIMVSAARATVKQEPGCYTMIEIPVIDCLYGDVEQFVTKFV